MKALLYFVLALPLFTANAMEWKNAPRSGNVEDRRRVPKTWLQVNCSNQCVGVNKYTLTSSSLPFMRVKPLALAAKRQVVILQLQSLLALETDQHFDDVCVHFFPRYPRGVLTKVVFADMPIYSYIMTCETKLAIFPKIQAQTSAWKKNFPVIFPGSQKNEIEVFFPEFKVLFP